MSRSEFKTALCSSLFNKHLNPSSSHPSKCTINRICSRNIHNLIQLSRS